MNRILSTVVIAAFLFAMSFAGIAEARNSKSRNKSVNGTFDGVITRLNRTQMAFETGKSGAVKMYTVNYDRDTTVSGGGKQGTLDDLEVGQQIKITVKNNKATKIEVHVEKR